MKLSKKARKLISCMISEILLAIAICNVEKVIPTSMSSLIICLLKLLLAGGLIGIYAYIQKIIKN